MAHDHPITARDWQVAYAWVEDQARAILDQLSPGCALSTTELAQRVYPMDHAAGKKRVFKALAAAATKTMTRYVTFGEPEKIGPRTGRRKTWHRPGAEIIPPPKKVCAGCGRPL